MNLQLIVTALLFFGFIFIMIFTEYVQKRYKVNSEHTRKFAHITASLSSLIFIFTVESHWYVLFVGGTLGLVLFIGKQKGYIKSITSVDRKTGGSYILPFSIYLIFLISDIFDNDLLFILPILILGISDPLAGIFGRKYKNKTKEISVLPYNFNKTFLGSSIFFISAFLISLLSLYFFDYSISNIILLSILIAISTTIVEIVSSKGIDNISVPLVGVFILIIIG